jgi:hypothetical protein
MTIELAHHLGRDVDELLNTEPFSGWHAVRSIEMEPSPKIWYEFEGHGVEVICDRFDRIRTVFLNRGDAEALIDIPFAMSRKQVLERFGAPANSGRPIYLPGTGALGPWDRFLLPEGVLHIQYGVERDEIDMVTLMHPDAVPR